MIKNLARQNYDLQITDLQITDLQLYDLPHKLNPADNKLTCGEEIHQAERFVSLDDDFFERALGARVGFCVGVLRIGIHFEQFVLQNAGHGNRQRPRIVRLIKRSEDK